MRRLAVGVLLLLLGGAAYAQDGAWIAYVTGEADCADTIGMIRSDGSETRTVDALGCISKPHLSWSPDGTRLAYASDSGLVMLATSTEVNTVLLESDSEPYTHPIWSPDGLQIAFLAESDDTATLSVIDVETQERMSLVEGVASGNPPVWSRDGTSLLVRIENDFYSVNASSGGQRPLADSEREVAFAEIEDIRDLLDDPLLPPFDIAPDATRIAYANSDDLCLIDLDSGEESCFEDLRPRGIPRWQPTLLPTGFVPPEGAGPVQSALPDAPDVCSITPSTGQSSGVNVREAPDFEARVIAGVPLAAYRPVTGVVEGGAFYEIRTGDGRQGYVAASVAALVGPCGDLPVRQP